MENYFEPEHFSIFSVDGLDERMALIREQIQPVFQSFGDEFKAYVNTQTAFDGGFHIAQHRRRTANAPESTWSALGGNARGYKKYPHIQLGINSDHIFLFLSLIDNPVHEKVMGQHLLENLVLFDHLSEEYVISPDHTKPDLEKADDETIEKTLKRLLKVKKGEFMIGKIMREDSIELSDKDAQFDFYKKTLDDLMPIYSGLIDVHQKNEDLI